MEVQVLVPSDKVTAFYGMYAAWLESAPWEPPAPGGAPSAWTTVKVPVATERASDFFGCFARWLQTATTPAPVAPVKPLPSREEAEDIWNGITRPLAKEFLLLLSDMEGRAVPWSTLGENLGLPASPSLERDLPELTSWCAEHGRRVPIEVYGEGAERSLRLDPVLGNVFRDLDGLS